MKCDETQMLQRCFEMCVCVCVWGGGGGGGGGGLQAHKYRRTYPKTVPL